MAVLQMSPDQINALDPTQRASVMQLVRQKGLLSIDVRSRLMVTETTVPRCIDLDGVVDVWVLESTKGIHWFEMKMSVTHGVSDQKIRGSNSVYASTSSGPHAIPL